MLKNLLFMVAALVVFTTAQPPKEEEFDEVALENFAAEFKTEIIDKENLTCENYEQYCDGKGADDFGQDAASCKIWTGNYLCKKATDINGLKRTLKEINAQFS